MDRLPSRTVESMSDLKISALKLDSYGLFPFGLP